MGRRRPTIRAIACRAAATAFAVAPDVLTESKRRCKNMEATVPGVQLYASGASLQFCRLTLRRRGLEPGVDPRKGSLAGGVRWATSRNETHFVILAEKLMSLSKCRQATWLRRCWSHYTHDVPQHCGAEAQAGYRHGLRHRSELIYSKLPYEPAVLTTSWRWDSGVAWGFPAASSSAAAPGSKARAAAPSCLGMGADPPPTPRETRAIRARAAESLRGCGAGGGTVSVSRRKLAGMSEHRPRGGPGVGSRLCGRRASRGRERITSAR